MEVLGFDFMTAVRYLTGEEAVEAGLPEAAGAGEAERDTEAPYGPDGEGTEDGTGSAGQLRIPEPGDPAVEWTGAETCAAEESRTEGLLGRIRSAACAVAGRIAHGTERGTLLLEEAGGKEAAYGGGEAV